MNDYQVQWGESAKAVKNAMKKKKAGKSKRQAGAGKSKVGDNKSPNSKKDIFVIIDGKQVVISPENLESKWMELYGDMEGYEISKQPFKKGKGKDLAAFLPQAGQRATNKKAKKNVKEKKKPGPKSVKPANQANKDTNPGKIKSFKEILAEAVSKRSVPDHKTCIQESKKLRAKSKSLEQKWKKNQKKAENLSRRQVDTNLSWEKVDEKCQDGIKDPKNSSSENTKKTCEMAKKLKAKFLSMKKKAEKIRNQLEKGRNEHRKSVESQKSQEKKCLAVSQNDTSNPETLGAKLGFQRKGEGLFKNGKQIKKYEAVVELGTQDPSKLK